MNPDYIDHAKYAKLASERHLGYFDDHGCCDFCSHGIEEQCDCEKLGLLQLETMRECFLIKHIKKETDAQTKQVTRWFEVKGTMYGLILLSDKQILIDSSRMPVETSAEAKDIAETLSYEVGVQEKLERLKEANPEA